jgi:hypothetical protein
VPAGSTQAVAVIDASPSFAAEDHRDSFPPLSGQAPRMVKGAYGRRIDEVRLALENEIMPSLAGNELGIVLFEGAGKDQVDLDSNFEKIRWEFDNGWIDVGHAPGDGSDYGKGLATALKTFADTPEPNKKKVIILFSDGGSEGIDRNALAKTIERIKMQKIQVIIVAVGSETEMKIPHYNDQGIADGYMKLTACDDKDPDGNCQTKLNMDELNELAADFGTQPLRLNIGDKLPIKWATSISGSRAVNEPAHLFRYLLVPCLLLTLILELRSITFARKRA